MAVFEENDNVNIWWFPKEFCQSMYGEYRKGGTNSCTLISLILANKLSKETVFHNNDSVALPAKAVQIFGDAINEGNKVYWQLFEHATELPDVRRDPNLNIPEAIDALNAQTHIGFNLQEWFYTHLTANPNTHSYFESVSSRIAQVLKLGIQLFKRPNGNAHAKNLFAVLIANSRTTVIVLDFPSNTASFFDSHQHGRRAGAVVAICNVDYYDRLVRWFVAMLADIYHSRPSLFEISFLTKEIYARNLESPALND
ncbi:uncharacterized protein LOC133331887 [Musca vetustissima]|uniref:uncharacterized protein LOC133331887 n=1 Tax=Musca vetustissima TaxID=27455 RepID=UPI002AB69D7B|nr:uncharacterized protein LOC133331887 [Musca vetustissima]